MAALPPKGKLVDRRPSLTGVLVSDVSNGVERQRAWPRSRGKITNPTTVEQMEWFRQAQWATKYIDPQIMTTFAQATKGTPLLPRDLATMMFAGRMFYFIFPDGRKMFSVQAKTDVSTSLDAIGQTPGMTLIRGPVYWEPQPMITGNRVGARITRAANFLLTSLGTSYTVPWTTEVIDQQNFWNVAAPNNIVIPFTGWYSVKVQCQANTGAGIFAQIILHKNGVEWDRNQYAKRSAANTIMNYMTLIYCNAGDILTVLVNDGNNTQTWSNFAVTIVGNA